MKNSLHSSQATSQTNPVQAGLWTQIATGFLILSELWILGNAPIIAGADLKALEAVKGCTGATGGVRLCESIAENNSIAAYRLAEMHYGASDVKTSREEAVKWYRRAAELGHASAKSKLARLMTEQAVPKE